MKGFLKGLTFYALILSKELSPLVLEILEHLPLYGMLYSGEDCCPEKQIDEVDEDQSQDPPSRPHLSQGNRIILGNEYSISE